jgi:uncharacterized membrane protein YoaK (UPF0700 family)
VIVLDANRRNDGRQLSALALLTFATGLVDAASVLGLGHVFTANMTGNVVFLGFSLAGQGRVATSACAVALGAFLIGALVGGRLAAKGVSFKATIALEAVLMTGAAIVAWAFDDTASPHALAIVLLASSMGIQNASVRKLGVADMTTTVLTLTLTGLAADSSLAGGSNPRWVRRVTSVAVMLLGALAGALLLTRGVRWTISGAALIAASACLLSSGSALTRGGTGPDGRGEKLASGSSPTENPIVAEHLPTLPRQKGDSIMGHLDARSR